MWRSSVCGASLFLAMTTAALPARAVPVDDKTPNIDHPHLTPAGTADFVFVHRFYAPGNKVINFPTFTLDAGIISRLSVGIRYASNSDVDTRFNEFEPLVKFGPFEQSSGDVVDLTAIGAFNTAGRSFDFGLVAARKFGFLSVLLEGRVFTDGYNAAGLTGAG